MRRDVRVLVVDDSDFFRRLVAGELSSRFEMETETATGAADALDRVGDGDIDCVVSDYDMPDVDGIELFELLRDRAVEVPFFLLTAAGSEEVASEAITAGVTDYFRKTDGRDQFEILGKRIRTVVSQRRAERDLRRQRRLHEDLWAVVRDLMHAPTRSDIDATVCRTLGDVDRFSFAWASDATPGSNPRAVAGIDRDDLGQVRAGLRHRDGRPLQEVALAERRTRSTTLDVAALPGADAVAVAVVPLVYRDSTYGVVGLATGTDERLNEAEREAVDRLGATVGHAMAAVETRREVETFREAVEQADPAIVITDTDGTIEYVNGAFGEITGYGTRDARGESFDEVVTGRWNAERWATVRERVLSGEPVREEVVQYRKDGGQFHADLSIAPITVEGDRVEKFVAIESDITDLQSREQRLQVLTRVLRHNLRNDLNVVEGRLALVAEGLDDDVARDHLDRAGEKLEDLLSLSRKVRTVDEAIRAAREGATRGDVGLADLLVEEVERVRDSHPDATVALDAGDDVRVAATHLDVAVRELLENAVEHNDAPEPHVTVSATVEDAPEGFVTVEVADDGPGIPDVERRCSKPDGRRN